MHSNILAQSNLSQHPLETTPKQRGVANIAWRIPGTTEKTTTKSLKSYSKFSQRISAVSGARLSSVGKKELLGKQLLLSAWELITDSPASGKVLRTPHRNWRGQVKSKKGREEKQGYRRGSAAESKLKQTQKLLVNKAEQTEGKAVPGSWDVRNDGRAGGTGEESAPAWGED